MANQEGIDIIIKAQDQYTATINKIDASTKLFGKTTENTQKQIAALEKYMITLVSNGIDPTDAKIVKLKNDYDNLSKSLNNGNGSLKDANKKWTSLALVVQDLPYGFRGIQNNLPALFGSIASSAGVAYFAFSALVALVTAYEKELRALFITTTAAEKQQELYNNVVKESGSAYVDAQTQVISLTEKVKLAQNGYLDKQSVVNDYNETIGKTIGQQKTLEGVNQALINQGPAYVDYMNKMAMAVAAAKLVAQETENIIKTSAKSANEFVSGFEAFFSGKLNLGGMVQSMIASSEAALVVAKKNKNSQLTLAEQTKASYVKIMQDMYKAAGEAAKKAGVKPTIDKGQEAALNKSIEQQQRVNEQVIQNLIDAKKQEVKLYEDDAYAKYEASRQLVELEKKLALEKLNNAGYTAKQIAALEVGIYQERDNKLVLLGASLQEQILGQDDKTRKEKNKRDKEELKQFTEAYNNQLTLFDEFYKNKQNLSTGNRLAQKSIYEQEASDLQYMLENNLITYQDYINRLGVVFKGWSNNNKAIASESASYIQQVGNGLMSALGPAMDMLMQKGANVGDILRKMVEDLVAQLIKVIATAAIAATLLSIIFPKKLAAAGLNQGSLFTNLFTQGMGLGSIAFPPKKMANGGIVSGPTMGLMGEYPGAQNNPEVVAPLDKLKSLMGEGDSGGQFVLRGNDLILAINRSNSSLNLRRGV